MAQSGNMYLQNSSLCRTLPPPPPPPSWNHRRRPNIPPLMKSVQWNYAAGLDVHAYPSPPMTTSPTSPKRSQFTDDRPYPSSVHEASSITSAPAPEPSRPSFMTSQVLPAPLGPPPHYVFGSQHPVPSYGERQDLQPRPRAQSIPPYQGAYQPTAFPHPPMMGMQQPAIQLTPSMGGPVTISAPVVGRIPRAGSRRAKAHVARACQNCKKAHLSCDEARPCARCVATRKESTCIDVEHKKRGRPRIQPERGQPTRPLLTQSGPVPGDTGGMSSATDAAYRILRSQDSRRQSLPVGPSSHRMGFNSINPRYPDPHQSISPEMTNFHAMSPPQQSRWRPDQPPLVGFLNLDLKIIKVMEPLRQLLIRGGDIQGQHLEIFVDARHRDSLRHLQTQLREERMHREPTFLPAIRPYDEHAALYLDENDVERITNGSVDHINSWPFLLGNGRTEVYRTRIRLAKTSSYFAVIELQRPASASPQDSHHPVRIPMNDMPTPIPQFHPPPPRDSSFGQPVSSSSFARSAPASPFSSLPQNLMTSLPPTSTGSLLQSAHPSISPSRESIFSSGSSYFPRQPSTSSPAISGPPPASSGASMQPPPQPSFSLQRSNSSREAHRPDPLANVQLPPIVTTSGPTTPVGTTFFDPQQSTPQHRSTPGMISTPQQSTRSARRSSPGDRAEDMDEEANRKRRRLNIGEIIEQ